MIDFFEIIRRALDGPYSAEQDFALKILVPKLTALLKGVVRLLASKGSSIDK